MPGGDGTGPLGAGPMSGRGMGFCAGYAAPGFSSPWGFRGRGRGFGMGFRRFAMPPIQPYPTVPFDEQQHLRNRAEALQQELDSIRKRLSSMEEAAGE